MTPQDLTVDLLIVGGGVNGAGIARDRPAARRRWQHLPPELVARLARSYGTRMERILAGAGSLAALGERFGAAFTLAEVEYMRRHEWAATAADILWRRSKLGLVVPAADAARLERYLLGALPRTAGRLG